jgi:amino acid transporter
LRSNTSDNGDADDEKLLIDLGYKQELKRVMGFISSFCLQFTIVAVCAGLALTFNTGFAAVGPRVLPAWVLGGSLQVIVALGVAVGVSAFPLAGGPYQIIGRLGFPRLGWVMGLALILGLIGNAAGEAVGLAPDYANYFGVTLNSHWSVLLGAAILIFVCMLLCLAGVRIAAFVNNGAVFAEGVAVLILVVGLAISWASGHGHFHNVGFIFSTAGIVKPGASTILPFLSALLVPIFVVSQFFANGSAGEETRHASRTVPRALWTSAVVSLVVGIVVLFLAVLAVRNVSGTAASTEPLTYILRPDVGDFLARTFGVLAELALTVNLALCLLVAARLLWAYGRNDEMPASHWVGKINREGVPINATVAVCVVALLFCIWSSLLNVLIAIAAVFGAFPLAVLIAVVWWARSRGTLPRRAFDLGRFWTAPVMLVGIIWSLALCGFLIYLTPKSVGLGSLIAVVILYALLWLVSRNHSISAEATGLAAAEHGTTAIPADATSRELTSQANAEPETAG